MSRDETGEGEEDVGVGVCCVNMEQTGPHAEAGGSVQADRSEEAQSKDDLLNA